MGVVSYADPVDYESVYGPVMDDSAERLRALLEKASRVVRDELAADGYDLADMLATGRVHEDTLRDVVVDMVAYSIRSASASAGMEVPYGASQATATVGPFSRSATFPTAAGSISFTKVHRRRLGLPARGRAFTIDLIGDRP